VPDHLGRLSEESSKAAPREHFIHKTPETEAHVHIEKGVRSGTTAAGTTAATVIVADTLSLPHPNHIFDFAICIAVIHHFASRPRRVQAIREILSKLRTPSPRNSTSRPSLASYITTKTGLSSPKASPLDGPSESQASNCAKSQTRLATVNPVDFDGSQHVHASGDETSVKAPVQKTNEPRGSATESRAVSTSASQALVFVWALEQKGSRRGWDAGDEKDQLVPWVLRQDVAGSKNVHKARRGAPSVKAKGKKNKVETGTSGETKTSDESEALMIVDKDKPAAHSTSGVVSGHEPPLEFSQPFGAKPLISAQGINDNTSSDKVEEDAWSRIMSSSCQTGQPTGGEEKIFHRYYHLYSGGELESEVVEAGGVVVESGYDRDNWWVVIESLHESEIPQ
jgi:hypothetical protein